MSWNDPKVLLSSSRKTFKLRSKKELIPAFLIQYFAMTPWSPFYITFNLSPTPGLFLPQIPGPPVTGLRSILTVCGVFCLGILECAASKLPDMGSIKIKCGLVSVNRRLSLSVSIRGERRGRSIRIRSRTIAIPLTNRADGKPDRSTNVTNYGRTPADTSRRPRGGN